MPKAILSITWKSTAFLLLWGLLLAPLIVPFSARLPQLYYDMSAATTALLAAWVMLRFVDHRPFVTLGFAPKRFARDVPFGALLGFIWLILALGILWVVGAVRVQVSGEYSLVLIAWAGTSMLFNTIAQEVLARGYILQTIQAEANSTWAILVSALLFMAYHAGAYEGAWLPAANVFGAGLVFGVAYVATNNLWLPIAMHFLWNVLAGPILGLAVSSRTDLSVGLQLLALSGPTVVTGGRFGFEGGVGATAATVAILLLALFLWRRGCWLASNPSQPTAGGL